MHTSLKLGMISLVLLASCNKKKFDGGVATRDAETKTVNQEDAIPPSTPPVIEPPQQIPATETTIPAVPEVEKSVEFGAAEIFRIGDGFASSGSACVGQVNTYQLRGTKYYFQFEVAEDNTEIDLSIGRICGVDQVDKDTFSLINETTKTAELAEKPLPKGVEYGPTAPWVPYPKFKLQKGVYSVVIHSKNIHGKIVTPGTPIDPNKDEHDDFLVGNIKLKANNRVKAIKIYAE